ncbi:hypothetical+protein [Methylocapsa aurea]|uniref:M15 family metallopeptidase n=1 Tax=Methylocapsa aurea TaxID=663610 RepID=UPI003D18DDC6
MTDSSQLFDVLGALTLGGLLGAIGQGLRVIAGLKKMNDDAEAADVTSADLFSAARLATSLMIGFVAGVATTLSLGPAKLMNVDPSGSAQILLGVIVAGYVGSDAIEAFTRNLASVPAPKIDASLFERIDTFSQPTTPSLPPPASPPPSLPAVPGRHVTLRGAMSTFGGPDNNGVGPDEGLALLEASDLAQFPELFLPQQPPGTTGLARRLDPEAFYIACRWNYDDTPRAHLKKIQVSVVNPTTGAAERAQPVDWGPKETTGRVADLSPGLARKLGLSTDQNCVVVVPLPESAAPAAPPLSPAAQLKVLKTDEIREIFGRFAYVESSPRGAIAITDDWPSRNIVTVKIEALAHLVAHGEIACNKAIAEPLQAAIAEIAERNLLDRILKWDGCHVPRHKSWNPNRDLSAHSWGVAFDINARWNAYGAEPPPKGSIGSVIELVPIFESFGFAWGGYFRPDSTRDGMHFEYCRRAAPGGQIVS